jgi:hypothetical protein
MLFMRLQQVWTDTGYKQTFAEWVSRELGWMVEQVRHPTPPRGEYAALMKDFIGEEA